MPQCQMPNQCGGGLYFHVVCCILVLSLALSYPQESKVLCHLWSKKNEQRQKKLLVFQQLKHKPTSAEISPQDEKSWLCWVPLLSGNSALQKLSFLNTCILNTGTYMCCLSMGQGPNGSHCNTVTVPTQSSQNPALAKQTRSESTDCSPAWDRYQRQLVPLIESLLCVSEASRFGAQSCCAAQVFHTMSNHMGEKTKNVPSCKTKSQRGSAWCIYSW